MQIFTCDLECTCGVIFLFVSQWFGWCLDIRYWGFMLEHGLTQPRGFRSSQCQTPCGKAKRFHRLVLPILLWWCFANNCWLHKTGVREIPKHSFFYHLRGMPILLGIGVHVLWALSPVVIPFLWHCLIQKFQTSWLLSVLDGNQWAGANLSVTCEVIYLSSLDTAGM